MQPWDYYFTVPTWVRMEVSRSSHIKSNLLWLHNFEPKHKRNSTRPRKCEIHIFIVRIWLMICYFVLKLHAYLTLKKERVNRKSKSCHTQKEIVTSLQPKHWGKKICILQNCYVFCATLNNFHPGCLELCLKTVLPSLKAKHKFQIREEWQHRYKGSKSKLSFSRCRAFFFPNDSIHDENQSTVVHRQNLTHLHHLLLFLANVVTKSTFISGISETKICCILLSKLVLWKMKSVLTKFYICTFALWQSAVPCATSAVSNRSRMTTLIFTHHSLPYF